MKKILLSALVALSAQSIWADEYNYLTVAYNSVEQSIALGTVKKITFQGGNCVVSTTEGEFSYPLSQMEKMRFTADPTAIERLPLQAEGLKCMGTALTVGQKGLLHIYNTSGALVRVANVAQAGSVINLGILPKGVYIVRMGDKTIKVSR